MGVRTRKYFPSAVVALLSLFLILLFSALKTDQAVAEGITRTISRAWVTVAGGVNSIFPFSIYELGAVVLVLWAIAALCIFLWNARKRRYKEGLLPVARLVAAMLCIFAVYSFTASPAYYRAPIPLPDPPELSAEESVARVNLCLEELNRLAALQERDEEGNLILSDWRETAKKVKSACDDAMSSDYFHPVRYPAKRILFSDPMSHFGIIGITFLPTGEVNLNRNTAPLDLPHLIAHETAHLSGAMRETDADTLAVKAVLSSSDPFLRYSGLMNAYNDLISIALLNEADASALLPLSSLVRRDFAVRAEIYRSYSDIIAEVGDFFNDLYLKISGVKEGTDSYYQSGSFVELPADPDAPSEPPRRVVVYSDIQKVLLDFSSSLPFNP